VGLRQERVVTEVGDQCVRGVEVGLRQHQVAGGGFEPAGEKTRPRTLDGRPVRPDSVPHAGGAGDAVPEHHPRPGETECDPRGQVRCVLPGPAQGRVDVGPLGSRERQARRLLGRPHVRVAPAGLLGVPLGVRSGGHRVVPGLSESPCRECADAVEQPVPLTRDIKGHE
jgi:hypothetical protein